LHAYLNKIIIIYAACAIRHLGINVKVIKRSDLNNDRIIIFLHTVRAAMLFALGLEQFMNVPSRTDIKKGIKVKIVLKSDQRTRKLTDGVVESLLTKSSHHPHGIKVMLEDGRVGRVQMVEKE